MKKYLLLLIMTSLPAVASSAPKYAELKNKFETLTDSGIRSENILGNYEGVCSYVGDTWNPGMVLMTKNIQGILKTKIITMDLNEWRNEGIGNDISEAIDAQWGPELCLLPDDSVIKNGTLVITWKPCGKDSVMQYKLREGVDGNVYASIKSVGDNYVSAYCAFRK